jgi:hypothetical protein
MRWCAVAGLVAALGLLALPATADDSVVYTGCIQVSNGSLYNVHEGTVPMQPCKDKDKQIGWNMAGVKGDKGDTGLGIPGNPGQDGRDGRDGRDGAPGPAGESSEGAKTPLNLSLAEITGANTTYLPVPDQCLGRILVIEGVSVRALAEPSNTVLARVFLKGEDSQGVSTGTVDLGPVAGQSVSADSLAFTHYQALTFRLPTSTVRFQLSVNIYNATDYSWHARVHGYCIAEEVTR